MRKISFFLKLLLLVFLQGVSRNAYGGQAVVGGVMMKGPTHYTVCLNTLDGVHTKVFKHRSLTKRYKILGIPILRGMVMLVEMMFVGYKTIDYSARVAIADEEKKELNEQKTDKGTSSKASVDEVSKASAWLLVGTLIISLIFAIFLFKFLPLGIASLVDRIFDLSSIVVNIIDGVIRAAIFILYIYAIGKYKDVQDLFSYHGAEHKTINCYESGKTLTRKNIMASSQVHLRCGTTFLFVVLFLSLLVYLFIPSSLSFIYKLLLRLALLPVIAGIAYELQRFSAKQKTGLLQKLMRPGLWLQALTVNAPTLKHVRAGKASLEALIVAEK